MEDINLTFLGTGNAVPTEKRNHTSILASFANENILIDCGEGTQRQLKVAKISASKITRIFITHWHGDHILGLPGLLQTLAMTDYQKTLKIYGPQGTKYFMSLIEKLMTSFKIKIEIYEVVGEFIKEKFWSAHCLPMNHGCPANAYSITLNDRIRLKKDKIKKLKLPNSPLIGQLSAGKDIVFNKKKIKAKDVTYQEKGKKVTFILDTGMNENALRLAANSDLLITESTFSSKEAEQAKEYKHLTSQDAATIAKKSKSKKLILTHISQRYEHNTKPIEQEAKKIFKNTKIVSDLDSIKV